MKMYTFFKKIKWQLTITLLFASGLYYYFNVYSADSIEVTSAYFVVDTVAKGEVTSGIQTTGEIIAAQKLDIDVYKQLSRIDVVNVANGTHVEAGDIMMSFDKSDAYVDTQSARVSVAEAELSLQEERISATDPSINIRTKENQIIGFNKIITDTQQNIKDAFRDFLNKNLEVVPHSDKETALESRTEPVLSGRYVSDEQGQYVVEVYSSAADSGFSYRLSGLETQSQSIILGKAVDLGNRGLKITFPTNTRAGDKWVVYVPNAKIATYNETKNSYDRAVIDMETLITDTKVKVVNAEQELKDLKLTDSSSYRNLNVEKAVTTLSAAQQRLSKNYDVVQERNIVSPFSGTVEGMENVVVGATPVGGASDSINLGTLISDEFLTTFTLGAADVAKITIGQKVKVTVTSFVDNPVFEAVVTQISSLPESSGVAQYKVQALLTYDRTKDTIVLREGMLADIEVVEKEKTDALRIPIAAVSYEQGKAKVTVVESLTEEQALEVSRQGIVRTDSATLPTHSVTVTLGIVGQYYVEVLDGLSEGDLIVGTSLVNTATTPVVQQANFGPGGGGERATNRNTTEGR